MQVELNTYEVRLLQMSLEPRIDALTEHIAVHGYAVHKFPSVVRQADEAYLSELKALWTKLERAQCP